jgi:hypothetical protein
MRPLNIHNPNAPATALPSLAALPPDWDTMDFDALYGLLNNPARLSREGRAANSTFNAVLFVLRRDGEAALARQAERLSEFSARQLESLIVALQRLGAGETLLLSLAELLP